MPTPRPVSEQPDTPAPAHSKVIYQVLAPLSVAYLVLACLIGTGNVVTIIRHYFVLPFGDYWIWLAALHEKGALGVLKTQFNEHRLTVPGLFFLADYRYLGAANSLVIAALLFFHLSCIALAIFPVARQRNVPWPVRCVFSGFAVIAMLWFIQAEDLFLPYQIQVACADLGTLAALTLFYWLAGPRPPQGLLAAAAWGATLLCGLCATFSFGDGMLVWPALLFLGWTKRVKARSMTLLAAASVCALGFYFVNYRMPPGSGRLWEALPYPIRLARYVVLMMALPFYGDAGPDVSFVKHAGSYTIAIVGVILCIVIVAGILFRERPPKPGPEIISCAAAAAALGAACMASVGRFHFPVEQALSGRYAPIAILFWVNLAAMVTVYLCRWESPAGLGIALWCALLMIVSAGTISTNDALGTYFANREKDREAAALSIAVGVPDIPRVEDEMKAPMEMLSYVDLAATRQLGHSMFARPETAWIGTPLRQHFDVTQPADCSGAVDLVNSLPPPSKPGVRLLGWAWNSEGHKPIQRIWVVDTQDTIRGFGVLGISRPDVAAAFHDDKMQDSGWVAYAQFPPRGRSFRVLAETREGKSVCPVGIPLSPAP